jgi:hypothetical protein
MKRAPKPLPGQLSLFRPSELQPILRHDPEGLSPQEIACWLYANSAGRMSRGERSFIYQFGRVGGRLSERNKQLLSALHERIGGCPLPNALWWERSKPKQKSWRLS